MFFWLPPSPNVIEFASARLQDFQNSGSSRTMVLAHGIFSRRWDWDQVSPRFPDDSPLDYRSVRFYPGP